MFTVKRIKNRVECGKPGSARVSRSSLTFSNWSILGLMLLILWGFGLYPAVAQSSWTLTLFKVWVPENADQKPLRNPGGVCTDPEGMVYVADTGNHRLVVFDKQGRWVREIGGLGIGAYQFNRPSDVTAKLGLDLLVADAGNDRIQRFNRRLGYIATIRDQRAFTEPISLDVSTFGDFFVMDGSRRRLVKIDALTKEVVIFGGIESGSGELEDPKDVDVQGEEIVWVADGVSGNVVQFDLFGNYLTSHYLGDRVNVRGIAAGKDCIWIAAQSGVGCLSKGRLQWCLEEDDLKQAGLISIDDLAVSRGNLIVLDGTGGKIAWFRIEGYGSR
jgi:hypothetical protein